MKKKLELPNVTLLSATSSEMDAAQISMRISLHNIKFGKSKLLCSSLPKQKYPDIEYVSIPPLNSVDSYNQLIFQDLHKYFETSHCLIVQADSFVVNSDLWKKEFLEYDYIGGPWPNNPYLAFINAGADHTPFPKLQSPFNRFEHGRDTEGDYLNMLHYTDWALNNLSAVSGSERIFETPSS